jgi:glutamate dehydrogenase/leucine dehydrogenase
VKISNVAIESEHELVQLGEDASALRPSRGMTFKNAAAGLALGGGKSVDAIYDTTLEIFRLAQALGLTTAAAELVALERLKGS